MNITNPVTSLLKHVTITLLITIIGLLIGSRLPYSVIGFIDVIFFALIILSFILVLFSKRPKNGSNRRRGFPMALTYGYSLFLGITLTPTLDYYIGAIGSGVVLAVFIGTLGIVGVLSLLSYTKGSDSILKMGPILFVSTIVLLILTICMMFFSSFRIMEVAITIFSIIIFSGWVIYDVYRFKRNAIYITSTRELAPYVLDIYIDIINLFLDILRLVARFKDS